MLSIPLEPKHVTPIWLTAALGAGGGARTIVESVGVESIQSLTSTMHRLRLVYSNTGPAGPESLVWKQSAIDPAVRAAYGHFRGSAYEREVRFYREIAQTTSARVPRCYLAEYNAATDEHVLLLEDLGASHEAGNSARDVSPDDVALCLNELALLHAAHWREPDPLPAEAMTERRSFFRSSLAECREFLSEIVGPELLARLDAFDGWIMPWAERLNRGALSLIHADVHAGNVLFPTRRGERAVMVDWQGWRGGPPARDVGRALVLMMDVEVRRRSEREIVAEYCALLRRNGVAYDDELAFADYRIAAAYQWSWAVTFARRRDAWDEPTRAGMPGLIRRAAMAALDALYGRPLQ
ncbi:MAG: phosphotransferase [Chloroflexi bacterium]|nr:phosphotransferase [Chloroflexota bacterium]